MAEIKVQKIYENALSILGKTEEGTDFPFMDRVPAILNVFIGELNLFRSDESKLNEAETIKDSMNLGEKEALALSYCLASAAAVEIKIPELQVKHIFEMRNRLMSSFTTGMEAITETIGV